MVMVMVISYQRYLEKIEEKSEKLQLPKTTREAFEVQV